MVQWTRGGGLQPGMRSLGAGFSGHLKPSVSLMSVIISTFPQRLQPVRLQRDGSLTMPGNASHFWMVLMEVKAFHFIFPRAMLTIPHHLHRRERKSKAKCCRMAFSNTPFSVLSVWNNH